MAKQFILIVCSSLYHSILFIVAFIIIAVVAFPNVAILAIFGHFKLITLLPGVLHSLSAIAFMATTGVMVPPFAALSRWSFLLFWHWQLPTHSGAKSYQNLLVEVYGMVERTNWLNSHIGVSPQQLPINFIRNGYYYHSVGTIISNKSTGFYLQSLPIGTPSMSTFAFYDEFLSTNNGVQKGNGTVLRCLER